MTTRRQIQPEPLVQALDPDGLSAMELVEHFNGALQLGKAPALLPHLDQQQDQANGQEQFKEHGGNRNGVLRGRLRLAGVPTGKSTVRALQHRMGRADPQSHRASLVIRSDENGRTSPRKEHLRQSCPQDTVFKTQAAQRSYSSARPVPCPIQTKRASISCTLTIHAQPV